MKYDSYCIKIWKVNVNNESNNIYPLSNRYSNLFSLIQREFIILREHVIEKTKTKTKTESQTYFLFLFFKKAEYNDNTYNKWNVFVKIV